MTHIQKNCEVTFQGKKLKLDILVVGREGYKAPKSYYILLGHRSVSPYEQKIKGWGFTLNTLFKLTYGPAIHKLIPADNVFLKVIKAEA